MKQRLNSYKHLKDAQDACHRLNSDPYTKLPTESQRPRYTVKNDKDGTLYIEGEYFFMDNRQFARKQIRNKRKPLEANTI